MEPKHFDLGWEFLWKLFFMVLLAWLLYLARGVIVALFLSIIISTALSPVVTFLERRRIPRILGAIIMYVAGILIIGIVVYAFIPIALQELTSLLQYSSQIGIPAIRDLNISAVVQVISDNLAKISDFFSGNIPIAAITSKLFGGVTFLISVFVLSFYLTIGRNGVQKLLLAILPALYEAKILRIYERVSGKIGRWLIGQLFLSLIVGIATFLGLWILGVEYSLFIGLIAAIAELVPYVGPIFTGSIAVLIGLSHSVMLGVYVFIVFVIIQQLEGHFLIPAVMRYTTSLNPAVVLVALLIGGEVFGMVGLILAVPVAVLFQEILEDWGETKQQRRGLMI
jgi:predicted PurR-regulated permease PerM